MSLACSTRTYLLLGQHLGFSGCFAANMSCIEDECIERVIEMWGYALVMFFAGVGVPTMAALSSMLGRFLNAPFAAALILFLVALCTAAMVVFLQGDMPFQKLSVAPKYAFLAGCLMAFYVLSITFVAPRFGLGNAVFFVLLGQLVSAAIIDHFGLFGAKITPLNITRLAGILVMALGVWLTQFATQK